MKRKDETKAPVPSALIAPQPEPNPLEIAVLRENFKLEAKMAKKWGRLSAAIILQINALNT